MTDLEITKRCAEAMGIKYYITDEPVKRIAIGGGWTQGTIYHPLDDDAQAMALVKRFGLWLQHDRDCWHVHSDEDKDIFDDSIDLNRAICECVAKLSAKP